MDTILRLQVALVLAKRNSIFTYGRDEISGYSAKNDR